MTSSGISIEIRYLRFSVILTIFWFISLSEKQSANKRKLVKAKKSFYLENDLYLNIDANSDELKLKRTNGGLTMKEQKYKRVFVVFLFE